MKVPQPPRARSIATRLACLLAALAPALAADARGGKAPLVGVECELASRLRGPARLRRDNAAARTQCLELTGERAAAWLRVRVPATGHYTVWARARSADGRPAALAVRNGAQRLSAAVPLGEWQWVRLGDLRLARGTRSLHFAATGAVRADQAALAGDPDYAPSGLLDTAAGTRATLRDVYFSDDFMRTAHEAGVWKLASGKWAVTELHKRERFDATRSANAFSFLGKGSADAPALAVTGYPFWRNYSIEAAVRSLGGGAFGLVAMRQDDANYYLLRCEPRTGTIELLRCLDGVTDRLGVRRGRIRVDDWYLFRLDACDGEISASIDGHNVLSATDQTFLDGLPGLWSADPAGTYFDDVLVRTYDVRIERFDAPGLAGWDAAGDHRVARGQLSCAGSAVTRAAYTDFEFDTTVRLARGAAGVAFDWRDPANHALAALVPGEPLRVEVREVRQGKATTLASAPLPSGGSGAAHALRVTQQQGRVGVAVDGEPVLATWRPDARGGAVGLWAAGRATFGTVRLARAQRPVPSRVHNRIFAGEDTMEAWASAASDWQLSSSGARSIAWHEIEHWGDCSVRFTLGELPALPGKLGLVVRADGKTPETGFQLIVEPAPKTAKGPRAPHKLTLLEGTRAVATGSAPAAARTIELRWVADSAVAVADGRPLLYHRATAPPKGSRAAVWTEGWRPAFEQCSVESANVLDDYFETAPVEWRVGGGTWEMQNRWTCSPQWSWMGGSAPDAAMLWSKYRFRGDITVHFFAAFQMVKRDSRIYRPGDLNVSICTDGQTPATGYSFIYGGWHNSATALLRRGKIVASTTKLAHRPPTLLDSTPETNSLHRKWWHVAIEKRGPRITCFVDDKLVFDYTDPEPLDGGAVCLWTRDNAIMIARAWIACETLAGVEQPFDALPAVQAAPPASPAPPAIAASHCAAFHDFEDGLGQWAGTPGASVVRLEARSAGRALAVTDPRAGGFFELKLPFAPFDALQHARLSFDYRFPPEARLNLYLKVNERWHAIVLTNPAEHLAGVPILGDTHVHADDTWHTADIDLRALLLRCYPAATALLVEEMAIGARDRASYLTAGFGGNPAGTTYRLDNVALWTPGPAAAKFTWDPKAEVATALDRDPATVPPAAAGGKGGVFEAKGLADGRWFFHLRAKTADGGWTRTAHLPIVVDAAPPAVASASPAPGARSSAHQVAIEFADTSGVNPKSLRVAIFDQELPVQVVPSDPAASYTPAAVTYDPVTQRLVADLSMLPLAFEDGQEVKLTVAAASDFAGHAMRPYTLAWRYDRSGDKQPPRIVRLDASHPYLCDDDFETGLGQWAATPEYSLIERDDSTAASGRYSLRLYNPYAAGPFTVTIRSTPFDAGRYPIVSFDYKVPPNLRADLVLAIGGTRYTVRFTDPNGTNCIGAVPEVRADGQWHHTEFNLHEILTTALPQAPTYVVTTLQLADTGFQGNADGVEYHIDNFRIAPAASTKAGPLEWKLVAADPSGIAAYQHSITALPGVAKWVDSASPAWQFRNLGAGLYQFAARARDRAGNWSKPVARVVLVDDAAPAILSIAPKPGARSAEGRVRARIADKPSGIDRTKTTLTVAGNTYHLTDPGLSYDARTGTLTWDAALLAKPITLPNGRDVAVALHCEDAVGNAAHRTWSWKMDYSLDKTPPPQLYVASIPSECLVRNTFEDDSGNFKAYGSYGKLARVNTTAATGRYCMAATPTRRRRYFGFYAYRSAFYADKHPILSFDYRIPPGVAINIHLHNGSSWKAIKLTSPSAYYPVVGEVPVVADDKWHHAEIDILKFIKPASRGGRVRIRYVLFADFGGHTARPGLTMYIDNFTIAARETGQNLRFEWNAAADATGIAGYAHAIDNNPATQPTKIAGTATTAAFRALKPGKWFFHLRARDGAGNWGPATHFPVVVPTPPPPPKPKSPPRKK